MAAGELSNCDENKDSALAQVVELSSALRILALTRCASAPKIQNLTDTLLGHDVQLSVKASEHCASYARYPILGQLCGQRRIENWLNKTDFWTYPSARSARRARIRREAMLKQEASPAPKKKNATRDRAWALGLTSFFFILLQSACTALMAISGLRLLIGVGSLAAATTGLKFLGALHGTSIRIPMEAVAIAGSVINLYAVWRVRSLRARPVSQWRMTPPTTKQKRSESTQAALAVLTLLLVAAEWAFHIYLHGTI